MHGDGEPVVLIHGTASASNSWYRQAPALISHGYRVYQVDLPGHGESTRPENVAAYNAVAAHDLLHETILGFGLTAPVTLVGHSLGGFFCLFNMLHNPEIVGRAVLIAPYYSPTQLNPLVQKTGNFASIAGKFAELMPEKFVSMMMGSGLSESPPLEIEDRQLLAENFKNASPLVYHLVQTAPDLAEYVSQIDIPTLVIWGKRERTLNPDSFPKLVKRMPNALGVCLEDCGHLPHLRKPNLVNEQVLRFLHDHPINSVL
jgi:4,5:9,10-diseco-3-hydroxy-5,9,17-trioxoandrosta-1(10),2-diene-4-oate hydrolase